MMTPNFKPSSPASEASGIRSGVATPVSITSPTARRRKLGEKRCTSLSASGCSSVHSLQPLNDDLLTASMSMKTVAADDEDEEKEKSLPRSAVLKRMRLMAKKRREFIQIQRILIQQQNTYLDLYAQIRDLETRYGLGPSYEPLGEVRVVSVTGWPAYDLLLLVRDGGITCENSDIKGVVGPAVMKELKSLMSNIPEGVLNMGADLMARRLEILEYLRSKQRVNFSTNHDWKQKNIEFDKETENLHKLVVNTAKDLEAKVIHCINIAKTCWIDRDALIKKIERLQKELVITQNKQVVSEAKDAPGEKLGQEEKPTTDPSTETPSDAKLLEELNKARADRESLKQVVSSAEGMLRTARARITFLERQLKDTRAQLDDSIRKHKEYEMLHRHRETSYDARSRKLLEVSKHGEVTIEMLSRQRDALELRVKELQEQTKTLGQDYEARELELRSQLEALQAKVAEQRKQKQMMESREQELERRLKDVKEQYNAIKERSEKLLKYNNDICLDYLPRKEHDPTSKETELWKELQVTKVKLERVSEELKRSRADKESLLNSLSRIAQEGPVENKMANELVNSEQKIFNLQRIIDDLKGTIKSMEESISQKDSQLMSYKVEFARLQNYNCLSNDPSSPKQDLALDLMDLSSQVAALTRERAELVSAVASRALMLERHERCAELFAQVTRTRRELAARLEGRSEHRLTQSPLIDVNLTASMSSVFKSAAETWTELRTERERVLRLQSVVMAQQVQLDRECRIRTELEQRRAVLERIFFNRANFNQPVVPAPKENSAMFIQAGPYFGDN